MRVFRHSALILSALAGTLSLPGQQAQQDRPQRFYFVALTDPACPVTGYTGPVPLTKEIHVLYYPMGEGAAIKKPSSPVVHMVFDDGRGPDDDRTLPFTKRDDNVWVATFALGDRFPRYAVYWIEDRESKQLDTNEGKYFEIPFCDAEGHREEWSVQYEAESYTGKLERYGIERGVDYSKAIEILDEYIHAPTRGVNLISKLWEYKLKLRGDTPDARSTLLAEIKKFISDHSVDGFGLVATLNFAACQDWFPPDTMETLLKAIENKHPNDNPRAFLLSAQALRERNKEKRIALQWELVDKYPNSPSADLAQKQLLLEVTDLGQREKLYQQLRTRDPEDAFQPLNMASMYLQANQKLPEALALLDETEQLFAASVQNKQAKIHYPESTLRDMKLRIATLRGDILIRLGKPSEAVSVLQAIKDQFTSGSSYYLLGKALEETGDKRASVDAYLESVVRPSKDQQRANAALEALWQSEKLGSEQDLQQRTEAKLVKNFSSASYQPRVLEHPAPDFDLVTLNGEQLSSSKLRGKKVILDFWAVWCGPCLWELKPLQDFQEKHPELVLAAVVDASTDKKQLETVIRDRKLTSLRISMASADVRQKFNKGGVPDTFIIDENGFVRIEHLGSVPDVARYFEADLKAIADAGPAKLAGHTAPQDKKSATE